MSCVMLRCTTLYAAPRERSGFVYARDSCEPLLKLLDVRHHFVHSRFFCKLFPLLDFGTDVGGRIHLRIEHRGMRTEGMKRGSV